MAMNGVNMPRTKQNDKRDRLILAADQLIYEKTFHTTTLADIAKMADVPLGNVYYYFKTKEAIMEAVLIRRAQEWKHLFQSWEENADIKDRLKSLIHHTTLQSDQLARFGCTMGSLCQELSKQGGAVSTGAARIMNEVLSWIETQFKNLGKGTESKNLAEHLMAGLQGMSLLTLTFREPAYLTRQGAYLENWVAAL